MADLSSSSPTLVRSPLSPPISCVVDHRLLAVDATLDALPMHHFQGHGTHLVGEVTTLLEQYPQCPGIIVSEHHQLIGMVSRQHLLEWLMNPRANLFEQPLSFFVHMARVEPMILALDTPIQEAAERILSRSTLQQMDPIVVRIDERTYRLLSSHDLLRTAWHIRDTDARLRLERTHIQMIQSEKMASLGRLVNGVAHEILDPVGFIWGNLCHISDYTQNLLSLIEVYEQALQPLAPELADVRETVELDYLREDLPKAIASIQSGADRLKTLAASLQTFCYIDEVYPKPADLHHCLDSIVFLLETHLSGEIEVVRNYGHLPPVTCYIGQLNQVFTNILSNAVQALLQELSTVSSPEVPLATDELSPALKESAPHPRIVITTQVWTQHFEDRLPGDAQVADEANRPEETKRLKDNQDRVTTAPRQHRWVSIQIADNGPGLSPHQQAQILRAFSRQNTSGKETSLSVSHRIVVEKHDGKMLLRSPLPAESLPSSHASNPLKISQTPRGTEFRILLPIQ